MTRAIVSFFERSVKTPYCHSKNPFRVFFPWVIGADILFYFGWGPGKKSVGKHSLITPGGGGTAIYGLYRYVSL